MYKDVGGYDMRYDEFKEKCRTAWSGRFNYLYINMTKNKNECQYRIFNESKNKYTESIPESEALYFFKCCSQSKTDKN